MADASDVARVRAAAEELHNARAHLESLFWSIRSATDELAGKMASGDAEDVYRQRDMIEGLFDQIELHVAVVRRLRSRIARLSLPSEEQ